MPRKTPCLPETPRRRKRYNREIFMNITRRAALTGLAALSAPRFARAQNAAIRIGILQDASGTYSYLGGAGSVACARQAARESGLNVEFVLGDHQNKPDNGLAIARQWLNEGVDAIMEFNNSAIALAANGLVREKDRVMLANNVGSAQLSGKDCTPNMTHWTFDTAMLARSVGTALSKQGGETWFFIRADYAFGKALRDDTAAIVEKRGGRVLGETAVPLGTQDFSSALLQAQSSGAQVVALALAGGDLLNCLKQAHEFGLSPKQNVATLVIYIQDIKALGLTSAQGILLTESFYWDLNDRSRAFTKRVIEETKGIPPNMGQAGAYSAVKHYLRAVADLGVPAAKASGAAAVARMKQLPINDDILTNARIRSDGRVVSDSYLFQVKRPQDSKGDWDLYGVKEKLTPDEAWRPESEGGCPLVKA
jgi:branched-chain amino acid transport system substrate-binding protein